MPLLSLTEASTRLGLSTSRLRLLIKQGRIQATMVGKTYAVTEKELERFAALPRSAGRPNSPQEQQVP